ncbi:putative lipase [Rubripirellula sp.]|nr:putative lipase [Rubripirellula sp.]MDC0316944.1 putative lipase [bacterium]
MNYGLILLLVGLVAAHLASQTQTVDAQENDQDSLVEEANLLNKNSPNESTSIFNVPFKTYGGTQFWTDHQHTHGYRIQSNWMTNHWRLLDASDVRRAWGTRKQCEVALGDLLSDKKDTTEDKEYVVLLHGLMRSHQSMRSMEKTLRAADCGTVLRFSYASTRNTIGDHAAALQEVLTGLPKGAKISFVAHSMGNIVVRHLLADLKEEGDPDGLLQRCGSMVMLGPPNQGAAIARRLAYTKVFGLVAGKTGLQLGPNWQQLVGNLAIPEFPFSIIAGDLSQKNIRNPILGEASDFVVQVDETQLEGRESLTIVPVLHSTLMKNPKVQQLVVEFLQSH